MVGLKIDGRQLQLYEVVAQTIGQAVLSGAFPPGSQLPSEQALAKQLGVGRSTVREAVVSLAALGVLDIRQGKGISVKELPTALLSARLLRIQAKASLTDVWEARIAVESAAAEIAARRRSKDDISHMSKAITRMEAAVAGGSNGVEEDTLFHLHLLRSTHNSVIIQMGEDLGALAIHARRMALTQPGRPASSAREHRCILEAIEQESGQSARDLMYAHLEQGLRITAEAVS